jgi:hypothetical protein
MEKNDDLEATQRVEARRAVEQGTVGVGGYGGHGWYGGYGGYGGYPAQYNYAYGSAVGGVYGGGYGVYSAGFYRAW